MQREWSNTIPADSELAGKGAEQIRHAKEDIFERLEVDHNMDGYLSPSNGNCDGYHKRATLQSTSSAPNPPAGCGVIYTKKIDGVVELFFKDATTGTENQITENGVLSLNTLQNNINANSKNITGANLIQGNVIEGHLLYRGDNNSTGQNHTETITSITNIEEAYWKTYPGSSHNKYYEHWGIKVYYETITLTWKDGILTGKSSTNGNYKVSIISKYHSGS